MTYAPRMAPNTLTARGVSGHRLGVGCGGRRGCNCARNGENCLPGGKGEEPVVGSAHERGERSDNGRQAILQPARRAATNQVAHDEPEIEAASMNQQALRRGVAAPLVREVR